MRSIHLLIKYGCNRLLYCILIMPLPLLMPNVDFGLRAAPAASKGQDVGSNFRIVGVNSIWIVVIEQFDGKSSCLSSHDEPPYVSLMSHIHLTPGGRFVACGKLQVVQLVATR